MLPTEVVSDIDPPGWAERDECYAIDGFLGLYEPTLQKITIFSKGIDFVADQLNVSVEWERGESMPTILLTGMQHRGSIFPTQ
jgi:hypothetical protein